MASKKEIAKRIAIGALPAIAVFHLGKSFIKNIKETEERKKKKKVPIGYSIGGALGGAAGSAIPTAPWAVAAYFLGKHLGRKEQKQKHELVSAGVNPRTAERISSEMTAAKMHEKVSHIKLAALVNVDSYHDPTDLAIARSATAAAVVTPPALLTAALLYGYKKGKREEQLKSIATSRKRHGPPQNIGGARFRKNHNLEKQSGWARKAGKAVLALSIPGSLGLNWYLSSRDNRRLRRKIDRLKNRGLIDRIRNKDV